MGITSRGSCSFATFMDATWATANDPMIHALLCKAHHKIRNMNNALGDNRMKLTHNIKERCPKQDVSPIGAVNMANSTSLHKSARVANRGIRRFKKSQRAEGERKESVQKTNIRSIFVAAKVLPQNLCASPWIHMRLAREELVSVSLDVLYRDIEHVPPTTPCTVGTR